MRFVKKVIDIDPHLDTFVRASEDHATPVTINLSHAVAVQDNWVGQKRRWGEAHLLRELLHLLDEASEVRAHEKDLNRAYLSLTIPVREGWFDLVTTEVHIAFATTHVADHLEFKVERRDESIVHYMNKTFTSWKGLISWDDLLRNVADLIALLSRVGLKRLPGEYYQMYLELLSRGFLDREAVGPRPDRSSSAEQGWVRELLSLRAPDLLADARLDRLALEPQVFERQPDLRAVCAFGIHGYQALRALAKTYVSWGDLTDAYELLDGQVAWEEALGASPPGSSLRSELATLPDVPTDVLCALATDPEWFVRHSVAERPWLPAEVRSVLERHR